MTGARLILARVPVPEPYPCADAPRTPKQIDITLSSLEGQVLAIPGPSATDITPGPPTGFRERKGFAHAPQILSSIAVVPPS